MQSYIEAALQSSNKMQFELNDKYICIRRLSLTLCLDDVESEKVLTDPETTLCLDGFPFRATVGVKI